MSSPTAAASSCRRAAVTAGTPTTTSRGLRSAGTTRLRGPVVADVAKHFAMRWYESSGVQLPEPTEPPPVGDVTAQLVRTVPEKIYDSLPRGDFRILESYHRALRSAQRLIYLENQFLWSPHIVELLAEIGRASCRERDKIQRWQ